MGLQVNLRGDIRQSIIDLAKRCDLSKVILFGSRARGDNRERSDIDLAISGGNYVEFALAVDEVIPTLLMFDVVVTDKFLSAELREAIERDGVLLYEKV